MFKILSIDGGGVRGMIPARILAEIEERTGKKISELFDLIVGTSTGGIIACGLAKNEPLTARQIMDFYREECPKIFKKSLWQQIKSIKNLLGPRYDRHSYDSICDHYFGEDTVNGCKTMLAVPSFSMVTGRPYTFTNTRTPPHPDVKLSDIAAAAGSAPTYFRPKTFTDLDGIKHIEVDGGLYANNPVTLGVAIALKMHPEIAKSDLFIVSLGTGIPKFNLHPTVQINSGIISWIVKQGLIGMMQDASSDFYYQAMIRVFPNLIRVQFNLAEEHSELDDASKEQMDRLIDVAEGFINNDPQTLDRIIEGVTKC